MAVDPSKLVVSYRGLEPLLKTAKQESVAPSLSLEGTPDEKAAFAAGMERASIELQRAPHNPKVFSAMDHRFASLVQSFAVEEAIKGDVDTVPLTDVDRREVKYDGHDPRWVASLFTWWRGWLDKHEFLPAPLTPEALGSSARVALLGDWGTGRYGAPVCASTIQSSASKPNLMVHLGDVYYSGTPREVENLFLKLWPNVPGATSRACNSNHEMYTGGNAYFRQTLVKFSQSSSNFALQNDDWLFIGLDSAYDGSDFKGGRVLASQGGWLKGLVDSTSPRKKIILFSHHQPFSLFESQGEALAKDIADVLASGRIRAWYFGHEHRCTLYDKHPQWGLYGRCVGHSGYPYFRDRFPEEVQSEPNIDGSRWMKMPEGNGAPGGRVLDGPNLYIEESKDDFGPNGYMTLELSGPALRERVHAADGTLLYDRELP